VDDHESRTSVTLIGQVKDGVVTAWEQFVLKYRPAIVGWCRRFGAQDAVLAKLVTRMREFQYDPAGGFRNWLCVVTRNAWRDLAAAEFRAGKGTGRSEIWDSLQRESAGAAFQDTITDAWEREILELAMANVRREVSETAWRTFELTVHEGMSGRKAASLLGMKSQAVLTAKHRVMKRIREECRRLSADGTTAE
jgi:RNA polymerase sigma-70 factor, ECF subfamily